MAVAALLRSVATKMARAPPRLPYAQEPHGRLPTSSGGLCLPSRFSTSTGGSMPPPANLRDAAPLSFDLGPPTYNKKVPSGNGQDSFMARFINAAPMPVYGMVLGGFAFVYFYVIPTLDRIDAKLEAFNKELKRQRTEGRHAALDSLGSQVEGRDDVVGEFSKGQRIQATGQGKD